MEENLREMQYLETPHGSGCFPLCCRLPWQQTLYLVMVQTQDLKKDTQRERERERERECMCAMELLRNETFTDHEVL